MLTIENSLEAHERNMGEILRNKGKYERLEKTTTGKSQVEYYFLGFLKGRNYFRGIRDALHFSKNSYQSDPTRPEAWKKNWKTYKNRMLVLSHSFPPSFLTGHEGNMGEIGRSMKTLEICRKKSMMKIIIEHHFAGIPKGRRSDRFFFLFFLTTWSLYMRNYFKTILTG